MKHIPSGDNRDDAVDREELTNNEEPEDTEVLAELAFTGKVLLGSQIGASPHRK